MNDMTIRYVVGDATAPHDHDCRVIAHLCNNVGGWGAGFVRAVSARSAEPEAAYRRWFRERPHSGFRLGAVQMVQINEHMYVANMIGQDGIRSRSNLHPIRYQALDRCLATLAGLTRGLGASVHMPRIGTGLAGGTWDQIEPRILTRLCAKGIAVTVYNLPTR